MQQPSRTDSAASNGRLAFLLQNLELCNHFAPVWDALPPGSFDVLLHKLERDAADEALARWTCGIRTTEELLDRGERCAHLVSNHPVEVGEAPLIRRLAVHNVRFMYAAGKSGWNLSDWNSLYDVILCFGPFHAVAFANQTRATIVQMGYPRFDRYFEPIEDRQALLARYGCDPDRRTVVWLPTWKDLSSVGWFDEEISALTSDYNVVVKLHPLMATKEPERVTALRAHRFDLLITDASDNLPLYRIADFMLFDYGGPPMAAIYTDKNLLLLDVPGAQDDPLLGPDSPDLQIRSVFGAVSHDARAIADHLRSDSFWNEQIEARRELRSIYFAPYYGFSARVAAHCLTHLDTLIVHNGHR